MLSFFDSPDIFFKEICVIKIEIVLIKIIFYICKWGVFFIKEDRLVIIDFLIKQMCHHKRFGVHGFWTGHGRSVDRSRIGLLIKLAGLFFNGPVGEIKHGRSNFFFDRSICLTSRSLDRLLDRSNYLPADGK